jgi:hypothetical protein
MTGKERAAEILRGPDGERIWLALVDYAQKLARRRGWRSDKTLPQGSSPRDIVGDVVIKLLEGERIWDETKEPSLLNASKGMVRSETGHLFADYEVSHVEPIEKTVPDGNQRNAEMFEKEVPYPNPQQELLEREQAHLEMTALVLILEEIEGEGDLESVFLALYTSDSPQEIAEQTGLPLQRVYSLRRELQRKAAKITPARVAREARERRKHG